MDNPGNNMDGGRPAGGSTSNKRLQQTQAQVDEVVGIMRTNVAKVLERDEKLSDLSQRADDLQVGASRFEQQATRLKRKYWWKNLKMMIIIGVICLVLLIIIIVSIASTTDDGSPSSPPVTQAPH